jgi:3-methyladenine DNA glycosylase AlkD
MTAAAKAMEARVRTIVAHLERMGSEAGREGMARFGIRARKAYGISVGALRKYAREIGRDHELAQAVWRSGSHEARLLAVFLDRPADVTPDQMDRWAADFENWADCDTACFTLFDRTPHAFGKVAVWSGRPEEFVKRAAFALLAGLALHDQKAPDGEFLRGLNIIELASGDERNFVWKAANWALRAIGERNRTLHQAAQAVAEALAASPAKSARWIGKDAARQLSSAPVLARLAKRG